MVENGHHTGCYGLGLVNINEMIFPSVAIDENIESWEEEEEKEI